MIKKVLIIDDSKLVHSLYHQLLKKYDCEIIDAMNGLEGLEKLDLENDIDVVLLDIDMPKMTGVELLEHLKKEDLYQDIPFIVISTQGKEKSIKRGLELGASAYLVKPFEADVFSDLLEKVIRKSRGD